jgi:hypothetical protein
MKAGIQFSLLITCAVYGMFLGFGEEMAPVDVMHHIWNGKWPANRSPRLEWMWLDGKTASRSIFARFAPRGRPRHLGRQTKMMHTPASSLSLVCGGVRS